MMRFKKGKSFLNEGQESNSKSLKLGTNSLSVRQKNRRLSRKDADWTSTSLAVDGMTNTNVANMPIEVDVDPLLKDIVFSEDLEQKKLVYRLYRDIYYNDAVAGSAVDLLSTLPFSDFTLGGVSDKRALSIFTETIERLNIRTILPDISTDYLVTGNFIGSLLFNSTTKKFLDIMPHQGDNAKIESLPFYSQDPIITVAFPDYVRAMLTSNTDSSRLRALRERLGPDLIKSLSEPALELDPVSTIFLPRRNFSTGEGTSWFRRILPIYLIEKNLFRGTLVESSRRQRGILHLTLGDGDQWEPSLADMDFMTELFNNADADPLGAIIATRLGVTAEEIRCLDGSTLISTEKGLIQIENLVQHEQDDKPFSIDLNIRVKGFDGKLIEADQWHYQGHKSAFSIKTKSGREIISSLSHKHLTLTKNGVLERTKVEDITEDHYLCSELYGINVCDKNFKEFVTLKNLTEEDYNIHLPYYVGMLATGNILENNICFCFYNENAAVRKKFQEYSKKFFDQCVVDNKSCYLELKTKVVSCLTQLGILCKEKPWFINHMVPDSILRSQLKCRQAFVCSYLESQSIGQRISKSTEFVEIPNIQNLDILLSDMGYPCTIEEDQIKLAINSAIILSYHLYDGEDTEFNTRTCAVEDNYGIPSRVVMNMLDSRFSYTDYIFSYYKSDDSKFIRIEKNMFEQYRDKNSYFRYSYYDNGMYEKELNEIRKISEPFYTNICRLFSLRYKYESIDSIESVGKRHLYDLSVRGNEFGEIPLFVANGLVTSNSGGEFWKVTDIWDSTAQFKLRAMGISEAFLCLSGDTLIHTEHGLQRIDDMEAECPQDKDSYVNINVQCKGANCRTATATKWWYRGIATTVEVIGANGYSVKGTEDHLIYVLSEDGPIWKKISEINNDDYLLIDRTIYNNEQISLFARESIYRKDRVIFSLMGYLFARLHIDQKIHIKNTSIEDLNSFIVQAMSIGYDLEIDYVDGDELGNYIIKGCSGEFYDFLINLKIDSDKLPDSVLCADRESKRLFLERYAKKDGDSFMFEGSRGILKQIQILLTDFGIISKLDDTGLHLDAYNDGLFCLLNRIDIAPYSCDTSGIPTHWISKVLHERFMKKEDGGSWFYSDSRLPVWIEEFQLPDLIEYESHIRGEYTSLFEAIRKINKLAYSHLLLFMDNEYYMDRVANKVVCGEEKVYDLSIDKDNAPAFIANGILVHNSGEANYACLKGNSYVPTDKGLLRIDEFVDSKHLPEDESEAKKDIYIPIDHTVMSRYQKELAAKWKYSGFTDILKITTDIGSEIECTYDHPILTLQEDGTTAWKKASEFTINDTICMSTRSLMRKEPYTLNLSMPVLMDETTARPTKMSPELAYILGICIFEGKIEEDCVYFFYPDVKLLEKVSSFFYDVFNVKLSHHRTVKEKDFIPVKNKNAFRETIVYKCRNGTVVNWLKELGAEGSVVPKQIMQADGESQLAFLSAFLENSGIVYDSYIFDRVSFVSRDNEVCKQIQVMCFAHGYMARRFKGFVSLNHTDSHDFCMKTQKYRYSKQFNTFEKTRYYFGFQTSFVMLMLEQRKISVGEQTNFFNDEGEVVSLRNVDVEEIENTFDSLFLYDEYDKGLYLQALENIRRISESTFNKIATLIRCRYAMISVKNIEHAGKDHVYDISMSPNTEPAFVANGMVVHNTADTSLTVFIDFIRAYRDTLTRKLFYNKLFPLISLVNGFTVNRNGKLVRRENMMAGGDTEDYLNIMQDGSKLLIPNVHWAKQLKPEGDTQYMDMLQQLTDKGVPVPLRALAAAGGFNLDALLADAEDDTDLLEEVSKYRKKIADIKKKYGPATEGEEGMSLSSVDDSAIRMAGLANSSSDVLSSNNGRRVTLSQRDYGEASEAYEHTKTGKKKWVYNQKLAHERANSNIAKAMKRVKENKNTPLFNSTKTSKK